MKFSSRMDRFGEEIFASLNNRKIELEKQGKKIYNLSVGTPDFLTPEHIKEALIEAAKDNNNWKYALRDIDELKEAVCSYYKRRFEVEINPEMVASCNGTQDGMGHLGLALLDDGDTVLLPSPCYPVFINAVLIANGKPVYYPMTKDTDFMPDLNAISEEDARNAKYMVVSFPANPCGSIANDQMYLDLIAFAKKYDILIVHDNAYSDIIFDGNVGKSFLSYPGAKEVGVEFFSLSKSFNVTGARISFLVGRSDVVATFRKLRSQIDFGMFIPLQKAAVAALTGSLDMVEQQKLKYQHRRDVLCNGLRSIGWDLQDSKGSMFVWAPLPKGYSDSMQFCFDLMEKAGVICTPGSSFGPLGQGYVRFALTMEDDKVMEALKAIKDSGILE